MDEKPADAVHSKPEAARRREPRVSAREADAVVSAGNTGAMLAAGLLEIQSAEACCVRRSPS